MDLEREERGQKETEQAENGPAEPPAIARNPPPAIKFDLLQRLRLHFAAEINTTYATIPMLACCLISGLVDSTIFNAYGTFVSMQTGNTIFLGLGGATSLYDPPNPKPYGWAKSLTSVVCFCLGCFFFSQLSRRMGPLRRATLVASFSLQSVMMLVAAAVVEAGVVDGNLGTLSSDVIWLSEIPIALLSFQSAGQIIGSRVLSLAEIPSVVLTSMLCDIASDPKLTAPMHENVKRNRRLMAFWAILIGAVLGGFISQATGKMQVVLWIAGGLKLLLVLAWAYWAERKAAVL